MDTLRRDVRFALRTLRKSPGLVVVAVASLALGIGAASTFYALLSAVRSRPMPYREVDRLVDVSEDNRAVLCEGCAVGTSYPAYRDLRQRARSFAALGIYAGEEQRALAGEGGDPEWVRAAPVSGDLLAVLGVAPAIGRAFTDDERAAAERVVLLGHGLWRRRFGGDSGVVGRAVRIDGVPHTVVGVMPRSFRFPDAAEMWMPLPPSARQAPRDDRMLGVIGRLGRGVTVEQAGAEVGTIGRALEAEYPETQRGWSMRVVRLRDGMGNDPGPPFWLPLGASLIVLLIACANLASLLLVRAAGRRREMAIRAATGASRGDIVRQLLTESTLLAAAGGALGLLLAQWGVAAAVAAFGGEMPRWMEPRVNWRVAAFAVALSTATGLLFGLAPALRAARADVRDALHEGAEAPPAAGRRSAWRGGAGASLVVAEIALAIVLLSGAALMMKTLLRVHRTDDLGYDPRGVLSASVRLTGARYDDAAQVRLFERETAARLAAIPGVAAVAFEHGEFLGTFDRRESLVHAEGWPGGAVPNETAPRFGRAVTPGYFRLMGVRLARGRPFEERDGAGAPGVAVVSEAAAAALWPGADPLGKRIRLATDSAAPWLTVVGVAQNTIGSPLGRTPARMVYTSFAQTARRPVGVLVKAACPPDADDRCDPTPLAPAVRATVAAADPDQPLDEVTSMEQALSRWVAPVTLMARLLGALAATAVLLAAVGVYGVTAYAVARQTRAIGIRVALGARTAHVLRLVMGRGLAHAAAGTVLGVGAALALTRVMRSVLFGTDPADPAMLAGVALALAAVALLATALPARRALRVSPMVALRSD